MNDNFLDRVTAFKERFLYLLIDTAVMAFAYLFAILLRFEFHAPHWGWNGVLITFLVVAVVQWFFLLLFGCHKTIWRYITVSDVPRFIMATCCSGVVLVVLRLLLPSHFDIRPPFSITLMNGTFVFGGLLLVRGFSRVLVQSRTQSSQLGKAVDVKNVLLIGAGDAGNHMVQYSPITGDGFHCTNPDVAVQIEFYRYIAVVDGAGCPN